MPRGVVAVAAVVVLALLACKSKPGALDVCRKLEADGVAARCELTQERGGLVGAAKERVNFDIPSNPGNKGQVLTFNSENDLDATTKGFDAAAMLAGRHRYANRSALVFVQLNSETNDATGSKAKAVVDGL